MNQWSKEMNQKEPGRRKLWKGEEEKTLAKKGKEKRSVSVAEWYRQSVPNP